MKYCLSVVAWITISFAISCAAADTGTVTGRLMLSDGKPLSEGQVFFFDVNSQLDKPVTGKFWRVPDAAEHTDSAGQFTIQLNAGNYYIGAIKRFSADKLGPPQVGDFLLPVHDTRGLYKVITVKANATTKLGTIKGIQRYGTQKTTYKGPLTSIEGRVTSATGQPAPNMYVLAYTDPDMRGRPSFVSGASDAEGRYRLYVDKGRTFYLRVRDRYAGGRPGAGTQFGVFGGLDDPQPVETKTSSTTSGIDIQMETFAGSGP